MTKEIAAKMKSPPNESRPPQHQQRHGVQDEIVAPWLVYPVCNQVIIASPCGGRHISTAFGSPDGIGDAQIAVVIHSA
eukprot:7104849-Prymnesium_polylepis.3